MRARFLSWWQKIKIHTRARFRSWWQKIKKHPYATGVVVLLVLILFIFSAYRFGWDWSGFIGGESKVTTTMTTPGATTATPGTTVATEVQSAKNLWDWLGLLAALAIPVVVGFGAAWFTRTQQLRDRKREELQRERDQQLADQRTQSEREAAEKRAQTEREIASDNQREATLQEYIDKMSDLLLEKQLRESKPEDEARKIARIRTLTVLRRLDAERKGSVLRFLHESSGLSRFN